jgi:phosphoribosyl 1,2-cyclic phosphate phosphodiesterase
VQVTILGCGTSSGVPRVGNDWGACDPAEPRNRRRRVSILVEHAGTRVLVDTGPDLREQLIDAGVASVDAVIWTHDHADHCHGIDDLRQVYHARRCPVPGYARQETFDTLISRFGYIFAGNGDYPPVSRLELLPDSLSVGPIAVRAVDQPHGAIVTAGLRFEAGGRSIVYSTDVSELTPEMRRLFAGTDLWIVDALRRRLHPSHASLSEALGWIAEVSPRRALLTHMDQSMDYRALLAELPAGVEPAYDGQTVAL